MKDVKFIAPPDIPRYKSKWLNPFITKASRTPAVNALLNPPPSTIRAIFLSTTALKD